MMEHVHTFSLWGFVYRCNFVFHQEIVVTTNPNIPASANLNNNRDGDGGEGSSQLSQQAAVSEARARGNYQPNSSAVPEGVEKPSTSDLPLPYRALGEF